MTFEPSRRGAPDARSSNGTATGAARSSPPWRRVVGVLSTILFAGALVLLAPVGEWLEAMRNASPLPLLGAGLLAVAAGIAEAVRLRTLSVPSTPSFVPTLRVVYRATCVGHLPFGVVGSDVVRAGGLRAAGVPTRRAVAVVAAVRGLGLATAVAVTATAVAWWSAGARRASSTADAVPTASVLVLLLAVLVVTATAVLVVARAVARHPRTPSGLRRAAAAVADLPVPALLRATGWSLLVTALRVAVVVACAHAVSGAPQLPGAVIAAGVGMLASVIPSIMAGVGPQEATLASTLALFGVTPAAAVVIALAARAVTLGGALLGAVSLGASRHTAGD